jgi:Uma2 family endonuclease
MSSTLIAPELESFPNRYRWSVEACYRLMDLGFLEGRFEILDGQVIDKMGQNPPHAATLTRLARILSGLFGPDFIRVQAPISIPGSEGVYNEPEPDIAVTQAPENSYNKRHPGPSEVLLVVEVADTTLRTDLILKARLYAQVGIPEYWALDLNTRHLHVHREPSNGVYAKVNMHTENESISLASSSGSLVAVADLLPPLDA